MKSYFDPFIFDNGLLFTFTKKSDDDNKIEESITFPQEFDDKLSVK